MLLLLSAEFNVCPEGSVVIHPVTEYAIHLVYLDIGGYYDIVAGIICDILVSYVGSESAEFISVCNVKACLAENFKIVFVCAVVALTNDIYAICGIEVAYDHRVFIL